MSKSMPTIAIIPALLLSFEAAALAQARVPEFTISTVAGNGAAGYSGDGGPATDAKLNGPLGVALDASGNIYVADYTNNRIRKIAPDGTITTIAGNGKAGYSGDGGPATSAELNTPDRVTVDGQGNVYIADSNNNRVRKVTSAGIITTVAGNGKAGYGGDGGAATSAELNFPDGTAFDAAGNLYISDANNNRVRVVAPDGTITTAAGNGMASYSGDGGPATSASLNSPAGVAVNTDGHLFISDQNNNRIRKVTNGTITTVVGTGAAGYSGDGGPGTLAKLNTPAFIEFDGSGNLYIPDRDNNRIRVLLTDGTIWTLAGSGAAGFAGDGGPAVDAKLNSPRAIAISGSGSIYIADQANERIRLLTLVAGAPSNLTQFTISTVAGNGSASYSGDGGLAIDAALSSPFGVAVDSAGNVYIADFNNVRIRKMTPNGTITTVAGTGVAGFSGDGGPAVNAMLNRPSKVSVDAVGNFYVVDSGNSRIRKVTPDGTITTVAGNGTAGEDGDGGPAVDASLNYPEDVTVNAAGDLFIADGDGNTVREVTVDGTITTVAGNGRQGYSGDGGGATQASLNNPSSVAVDSLGNIFIGDTNNNRIRKVANGIITTVAGNGVRGYGGDGGPATAAELASPTAKLDTTGNLYIPDAGNNRVRLMLTNGTIWTVAGNGNATFGGDGGPAVDASLHFPTIVALTPSGNVYIADAFNERIRLLTPVPQPPAIAAGGIVSASAFGEFRSVAPGSWVEIYGSNLAVNARGWTGTDFNGMNAPTSLNGTQVTIGGQMAFVDYISPNQVNALIPSNVATGTQQLTVTSPGGTTSSVNLTVNPVEPGLLAPPNFNLAGTQYVVAQFADGSYALPTGAIAGLNSRPAVAGDVLVIYGIGFGLVTPASPAGRLVQQANTLSSDFRISIGGAECQFQYYGLAPNYTGLYQFNIVMPNVASGNQPLTFTVDGVSGTQTLNVAIGQ